MTDLTHFVTFLSQYKMKFEEIRGECGHIFICQSASDSDIYYEFDEYGGFVTGPVVFLSIKNTQ